MAKAETKSKLGGCLYVVEADAEGSHKVYKVTADVRFRPDPYVVDADFSCNCKAGDNSIACKHSKMVERTLVGNDVEWDRAIGLVHEYLKKAAKELEVEASVSLLDLREPADSTNIAHVLLSQPTLERDRITIWKEMGPLLLVVHVFKDHERYRKALRRFKRKQRGS